MTIRNRTDYEAALKRQADWQRENSADPNRQRELRELTTELDNFRRTNPDVANAASGQTGTPDK